MTRIGERCRSEVELRGLDPESRLAERQERSAPLVADIEIWLTLHRARVAAKSPLGEALSYIAKYWNGLRLFMTDGRIEIDNNSVERTIRPIALNRKKALFARHEAGARKMGDRDIAYLSHGPTAKKGVKLPLLASYFPFPCRRSVKALV